jgi:hypothetical protein
MGDHVLRVAGVPPTWEQELMAGLLDLGKGAVVSRRAAAALHRFDSFGPGPVEFTLPRSGRGRDSAWTTHTALRLDRVDITVVGPFACTSAARTILDLARSASRKELERAIDSAVRDGLASPTFLRHRLSQRGPGHWGVRLIDDSTDAERANDAQRRNELQEMGYVVLEFTYDDVVHRPSYVLDVLHRHGL